MDYKQKLRMLKNYFNVFNNKELAKKLEITESAIDGWTRRKTIPKRYIDIIKKTNITQNGQNNININNGQIHINSTSEMNHIICEEIKKLSDKKREYFYHLIKAEILKENN